MIKKTLLAAAIMSSASNIALADPLVIAAPMPSFADQWLSYPGVDALFVVPSDLSTVKPIANKAGRAGIPLIVVNRIPDEKS
jgi:inositol transport system substrate-binding protein